MRSFIIHMSGDQNRQANAKTLLATLPEARILNAVVGRDVLAAEQVEIRRGTLHAPRYPFALSAGEVGCFLSHRACWQRIVDGDLDYALIVEDDLAIDRTLWPQVMDLIQTHAGVDTVLRLPTKARERPAHVVAERPATRLYLPRVIGLQTVAQVVGRNAARRFLDASQVLDRPVDTFLQMHWVTGQPVHSVHPNGMRELTVDLGGSTIRTPGKSGKMLREIGRAWYRAQVALRPQRV